MTLTWTSYAELPYACERDALNFVRERFLDDEPFWVLARFEFIALDGSVKDVDQLVYSRKRPRRFIRADPNCPPDRRVCSPLLRGIVLMSVNAGRQLAELQDDTCTRLNIESYRDSTDAVFKSHTQ